MRRITVSALLALCILLGTMQPALATEPQADSTASEISESEESVAAATAQATGPDITTESTEAITEPAPEEAEAPAEEQQSVRSPSQLTTSEACIAMIETFEGRSVSSFGTALEQTESAVNSFIDSNGLTLTQQQFDALVDIAFNCGSSVLSGSRLSRLLLSGSYTEVEMADAWCAWVNAGGVYVPELLNRRVRDLQIFFYGDYTGEDSDPSFRYIVHMPNGGVLSENTVLCYAAGSAYGTLQTPTREGKYFAGWFTAASGGTHIYQSTIASQNLVLYAHWSDTPLSGDPNVDDGSGNETPSELKTSEACIQFIKDHEGFSKYAQWDYGQWSIGYGTRCEENEFPDGITEEEADLRLREMVADFEITVDKVLENSPIQHTQAQYDAIISFTYNLGSQWINPKYNIYQYIVYGGYTEMEFVNTMGSWLSSSSEVVNGLARRRIDEADLYLNGVYKLGSNTYVRLVFNAMGGETETSYHYYKTGQALGQLPDAAYAGHYFLGWYDRVSGGEAYTSQTEAPPRGNLTLYARWQATGLNFSDVSSDDWFFEAVSDATELGLFQGITETKFDPYGSMNRAMLATVLYRMAGEPGAEETTVFTDVPSGLWFSEAIGWAYANQIVNGMTETTFAPFTDISREQLAVMLYRYARSKDYDTTARATLSNFADAVQVSGYAEEALQWAIAVGILNGTDGNRLDPLGSATRAQCAAMLVRFLDFYGGLS